MKTPSTNRFALVAFFALSFGTACSDDPSPGSSPDASTDASSDGSSPADSSVDATSDIDSHVGECTSGASRACCAARGSQTCDATGSWATCSVTATTETCNGVDDDCDGEIDETLTVACVPDADNDRYAGGSTVTMLCGDLGRAAWGNCPSGYVTQAAKLGDDCDDSNASNYQVLQARTDADADTYCTGGLMNICSGGTVPPGYRAPGNCAGTDDCNEADASLYRTVSLRIDADGDTYCTAAAPTTQCVGATLPAGRRFASSCNATVDCRDSNPNATSSCTAGVQSNTVTKRCDIGIPVSESATFNWTCPAGFLSSGASLSDSSGPDGVDEAFYENFVANLIGNSATATLTCRPATIGGDRFVVNATCTAF